MMRTGIAWVWVALVGCNCGAGGASGGGDGTPRVPPPSAGVTYEVHEWGLVRGTLADQVRISGPHVDPPPVPVAKPVLYFHREGEGALEFDLEVSLPNGRVVEHWPNSGVPDPTAVVRWRGVTVQEGTCLGSNYPSLDEAPCATLTDGCEASALREVETHDGDCLYYPRPPPPGGPTMAWNNLFYRGEVRGTPAFPLRLEPQPDGTLRVTSIGTEVIPGKLIRVHHGGSSAPGPDGAIVVDPPRPGQTIVVPAATGSLRDGAEALGGSIGAAGLTAEETAAFRRAWDVQLFGLAAGATAEATTIPPAAAMPMVVTQPGSSVLYVLPMGSADGLATLRFTPAPRAIRRAIVAWVDEPRSVP